jgi:thiol:disulfide interchange protein DsbD
MKFAAFILITLVSLYAAAQKPVRWKFSAKRIADKTYEIHLTARIEQPWHIYSMTTPPGGPAAAKIEFSGNPLVTITGVIREEGKLITKYEKLFGVEANYFEESVDFVQQVKIKSNGKTYVTGYIQYMVANELQSLPVTTQSFNIALQ